MDPNDVDGARPAGVTTAAPPPAAPVNTETKFGPIDQPNRLKRGVLGPVEVAASTMADIAPAMSFYFGFAFLAATSGIASPLTIIAAGIAVAFLANTLSRFMQAHPSTGSFITFIGMALGPVLALTTAIVLISGYLVNIFSIMAISGGFMTMFLQNYFHGFPSWTWPIFTLAFVGGGAYLMIRGVHVSVRWAGAFFAFEFVILVLVSVISLIQNAGHLNLQPFNPHYLLSGIKGLGLGFPLAVYMFIGWEAAGPMAEETDQPRRNIPRALFASVALMLGSFVLFAYATVEAFGGNVDKLTAAPIPFIAVAQKELALLAFLAYIAGVTSTVGCLIAAVNSQARLLFNSGREGLLPKWLGKVSKGHGTPVNALVIFMIIGLVGCFGWAWAQHITPLVLFAEPSTLGTILVIIVYAVANLSLPIFYLRHYRSQFSVFRDLILPVVGTAAIIYPLYYLVKPGQPWPFDWFPYVALALIVVALIYAGIINARDKTLGDKVGALVADE
jgi:amino acid transporter